jgi:two-component system chemotaxis response regulator CheB
MHAQLPVEVVRDRVSLSTASTIWIAPDDRHLEATARGELAAVDAPPLAGHRPSVTRLFESLAQVYGAAAVGVILSGIGSDGATGLASLRARGAPTFVQTPESAAVFGMPRAAIEAGAAWRVMTADEIGESLVRLAAGPVR